MSWRTVIISNPAKLDTRMGYLVIRGQETHRILLDEIETLIIEDPSVSFTGCLMESLIANKTKVIFCDSKRNPVGEVLPHHGSHDSSGKLRTQIGWTDDIKAIIWREIITEKIRKQADFLKEIGKGKEAELLLSYIGQVELYDATNREGHAAKVYFNALFGMAFTRSADIPTNAALNYGYSIILSACNREISANGYLTQLGIFHRNMFNHYNLGCDLMEPFRILVDRMVYYDQPTQFGTEEKHKLWDLVNQDFFIDGYRQNLSNTIKVYVKSALDAINDQDPSKIKFFEILSKT